MTTATEVRAANDNRYAAHVAKLQAELRDIAAREKRAEAALVDLPREFWSSLRFGVDQKRAAFDRKVEKFQASVDANPDFWGEVVVVKAAA